MIHYEREPWHLYYDYSLRKQHILLSCLHRHRPRKKRSNMLPFLKSGKEKKENFFALILSALQVDIIGTLTCCSGPKGRIVCSLESKVSENSFIAACSCLRWPHFGCLVKPGLSESGLISILETRKWRKYLLKPTILIKRSLIVITCCHKCRGSSSKIGSSMILHFENHLIRRENIMLYVFWGKYQFSVINFNEFELRIRNAYSMIWNLIKHDNPRVWSC